MKFSPEMKQLITEYKGKYINSVWGPVRVLGLEDAEHVRLMENGSPFIITNQDFKDMIRDGW